MKRYSLFYEQQTGVNVVITTFTDPLVDGSAKCDIEYYELGSMTYLKRESYGNGSHGYDTLKEAFEQYYLFFDSIQENEVHGEFKTEYSLEEVEILMPMIILGN